MPTLLGCPIVVMLFAFYPFNLCNFYMDLQNLVLLSEFRGDCGHSLYLPHFLA